MKPDFWQGALKKGQGVTGDFGRTDAKKKNKRKCVGQPRTARIKSPHETRLALKQDAIYS
jgi:hypothetical protein